MKGEAPRYTKAAVHLARGYYFFAGLIALLAGVACLYFDFPNDWLFAIANFIAGIASLLFGLLSKSNRVADAARDSLDE